MLLEVNDQPNWLKSKMQIKYKTDLWIQLMLSFVTIVEQPQRTDPVYFKNQAKLKSFVY